jgi:Ribbon-helix-helix domain
MSRKKISTTIYVTPEQSDKLKLLHERTKVPVAVYIREGIDLVLRHYGHLLPGQLPLDGSSSPLQANGRSAPARPDTTADTDDTERGRESPPALAPQPPAPHGGHAAHAASKK